MEFQILLIQLTMELIIRMQPILRIQQMQQIPQIQQIIMRQMFCHQPQMLSKKLIGQSKKLFG